MKTAGILNRRRRRALFLLAAAALLATIVEPPPPPPAAGAARASLFVQPVSLDEADAGRRRVGSLVFLRGWTLRSDDPRFGGISAMHVDGGEVTAVSDAGALLRFALPRAAGRQLLQVRPLPQAGSGDKATRDTEALLLIGGAAWLAFERLNAVVRFRRSDWHAEAAAQPEVMRGWRGNSGPEAMVRLADGRFLVFAEGRDNGDPHSDVALFAGDPAQPATRAAALRYRRIPGYRVSDAALLPDGRLLILNRRFDWLGGFSARLAIAETAALRAGATVEAHEIAALASPLSVDNMEALSVAQEQGRTIVRLASDDNFMALQRTLLLEFALEE